MKAFEREIAALTIEKLMLTGVTPDTMDADGSLVEDYGLDSVDLLELAMAIGRRYGIEFQDGSEENALVFRSIRTLAAHVEANHVPAEDPQLTFEQLAFQEIVNGLSDMFGFPPETLSRHTQLVEELDLDSLDALDLIVRLQDKLGARIPDSRLMELRTIGDVVDIVVELNESAKAS
ncbi:phosphopantetheine-binding protein [Microvenator marinus]|jgi:acyl carrier protein|nr:phosphopantetheine-binding protein [Microvenator marinus]